MRVIVFIIGVFANLSIAISQERIDCTKCIFYTKSLTLDSCEKSLSCNSTFKICGYFETFKESNYLFVSGYADVLKNDTSIVFSISESDSYSIFYNEDSIVITEHFLYYNILEKEYSIFKPYREFVFLTNNSTSKPNTKFIKLNVEELFYQEVKKFELSLKGDIKSKRTLNPNYWTIENLYLLFYSTQLNNQTSCKLFESLIVDNNTRKIFCLDKNDPTELQTEYQRLKRVYDCSQCNM